MHEWALAEAVVETVRREAVREGGPSGAARVRRVRLAFGELQLVDREIFASALADLAPEAGVAAGAFAVEDEPARFACRACGRAWSLADAPGLSAEEREAVHLLPEAAHAYLACPGCGSADFDAVAGRGVSIVAIELDDPASPGAGP